MISSYEGLRVLYYRSITWFIKKSTLWYKSVINQVRYDSINWLHFSVPLHQVFLWLRTNV